MKRNLIFKIISLFIIVTFLVGTVEYNNYKQNRSDIANHILRLHVIANSNSAYDQATKLKVRDAVIKAFDEKFEKELFKSDVKYTPQSVKKVEDYLNQHKGELQYIANTVLSQNKADYKAKVLIGKFAFPIKTYGYITLPAGEYQALKIVLGTGQGKNWWCVMFPPLCFTDITHGLTTAKVQTDMSSVLPKDEYEYINGDSNGNIVFKFKIFEVIEKSLNSFADKLKLAFK